MKNAILIAFIFGVMGLSSFSVDRVNYEQITFDYFISDILRSDFKDISAIEFKGKTENTFSTLGKYKICLKREEKLESDFKDLTKGSTKQVIDIEYEKVTDLTISDFKKNSTTPKLYIYPVLHVADNFYVFISLQKSDDSIANYIFKLNPEGKNIQSCKMN